MLRLLLLTLLAVAGCASAPPALTVAAAPAAATADPDALRGWWRVEGDDRVVLVDPSSIEVREGDRTLTGTWRADQAGGFLARIDVVEGGPEIHPDDPTPDWLAAATAFRVDGDARVLLDGAGAPVARLVPEAPGPGGGIVDPGREPDQAERLRTAPAAPVAAPLVPLGSPELLGYWFPRGATNDAFLRFDEGGDWAGSDGCNAVDGAWLIGDDGAFLATAPQLRTLMFCEGGADVATQLGLARRAAFDGADLVLLDAEGTVVGRYYRASRAGVGPVDPPTGG
ncbi:META domain-containing protein [Pseudonocardia lacus]|uniref:META domain-containing protein n=1 Tax=Pseudonocardia lacus TaxID=2835865 RepID=UPI001BDC5B2A|nr:META domain-containing protein [Pseudonocardia lacus]